MVVLCTQYLSCKHKILLKITVTFQPLLLLAKTGDIFLQTYEQLLFLSKFLTIKHLANWANPQNMNFQYLYNGTVYAAL